MTAIFKVCTFSQESLSAQMGTFSPYPYKDAFHEELAYRLQDPGYAQKISEAYLRHVKPHLQKEEDELFCSTLLKVVMILSRNVLTRALKEECPFYSDWVKGHKESFEAFLAEVCVEQDPRTLHPKEHRVTILTTKASGGNFAITRGLDHWLRRQMIETQVIDVEEMAKEHDAMAKATGHSYDSLYDLYFQKQDAGLDFLTERDAFDRKLAHFIPSTTLEKVKEKIRTFAPTLIIGTRCYKQDDLTVASSLGIPFRAFYCDYGVCYFHLPLIGKIDTGMFRFWLPELASVNFKLLFEMNRAPGFETNEPWNATVAKIATIYKSPIEEIALNFEEIGLPAGPEFIPVSDLAPLASKWRLQGRTHAVYVQMGKNGVATLEKIFNQLLGEPKHAFPVKYYFVCGTNARLKEQFAEALLTQKAAESALSEAEAHGHIAHQSVSELMNISSLMISKPGGATIAECEVMGLPLLSLFAHSLWEAPNENHIVKIGLGHRYDASKPLSKQVEDIVLKSKKQPYQARWEEKLGKAINLTP